MTPGNVQEIWNERDRDLFSKPLQYDLFGDVVHVSRCPLCGWALTYFNSSFRTGGHCQTHGWLGLLGS